jgi:hypothetical protein
MSEHPIPITPSELLERSAGELIDRSESLPELGGSASQVVVREPAELTAKALSGAVELLVFSEISAAGSLPGVTLLWLSSRATASKRTAEAFVGLEYLRIESSRPVNLKWFHRCPLRGLALADRALEDWSRLAEGGMPLDDNRKLEHLAIDCRVSGELPRLGDLNLRTLVVTGRKRPKKMKEIWGLQSLTRLQLLGVPLADLRAVRTLVSLSDLQLVTPKSFSGVSELKALRSLLVYGRTCPPVEELASVPALHELELRVETLPADVMALGDCEKLECLRLELGNISQTVLISLGFLKRLKRLKRLALCGVTLDRKALLVLKELEGLEELILSGDLGDLTEAEMASQLPTTRINLTDISGGAELAPRRIGDEWTLFRDLASVLGVRDNYEAEVVIRREVNRSAPDVVTKLEFDSESGAVSVTSRDRDAIERVVKVIARLKRGKTA